MKEYHEALFKATKNDSRGKMSEGGKRSEGRVRRILGGLKTDQNGSGWSTTVDGG